MKSFVVYLAIFILGVITIYEVRIWQVNRIRNRQHVSIQSNFRLEPPKQSLTGIVEEYRGTVFMRSRNDDDFKKLQKETLFVGESLTTGDKSKAKITYKNFGEILISSYSEVDVISAIPSRFLLWQKRGTVSYRLTGEQPLSVRSMHTLFVLNKAVATLKIDPEVSQMEFLLNSGSSTIALIDQKNQTKTWKLVAKDKIRINDTERTVTKF